MKLPSPITASTGFVFIFPSLFRMNDAPTAPGRVQAIVERLLSIMQVFGCIVGYNLAIHIFKAPVSTRTVVPSGTALRVS